MDDAPHTDDLDLAAVTAREELVALLRTVYLRADRPSLRVLEARTRHSAVPLSKTVASEVLKGSRFPRKAVMVAFLRACGVQEDHMEPWQRAWERVAVHHETPETDPHSDTPPRQEPAVRENRQSSRLGPDRESTAQSLPAMATTNASQTSEQLRQLHEENQELRRQLAASSARRAGRQTSASNPSHDGEAPSPVVSRRELGALLRALRLEHGLSIDQVAAHLLCSTAKVNRMESGFRSGTVRDVRDLCGLYALPAGPQRDHLMDLAHESKQQGWWQAYEHEHDAFETFIGLENGAASMKTYLETLVPGLLQAEGYMRALLQSDETLNPNKVDELIEIRLTRKRILTRRDPPNYWAIVDEAALRRAVGGQVVMRHQLEHLVDVSSSPNITLQILPFQAGAHPAMGNDFAILEFPEPAPGLAYVEGLQGSIYIERPSDLRRYQQAFEKLSKIALNQEDSRRFIASMAADLAKADMAPEGMQ